jgi:hypothetical protein
MTGAEIARRQRSIESLIAAESLRSDSLALLLVLAFTWSARTRNHIWMDAHKSVRENVSRRAAGCLRKGILIGTATLSPAAIKLNNLNIAIKPIPLKHIFVQRPREQCRTT